MKLHIGPYEIGVRFTSEDLDPNHAGEFDGQAMEIRLDPELKGVALADTLIHEICEGSKAIRDLKLPHSMLQTLATDVAEALISAKLINLKTLRKKLESE